MKQAIFLIVSNGVDGRERTHIDFATTDEQERDQTFAAIPNGTRGYHSKADQVVDLDARKKEAMAKLDGLDRLALQLEQREWKK